MVNVIKKEEIAKLVACADYSGFIYIEDRVDIDGMYYFCEAFNYCYVDINYLVMNVDYVDGKYKGIVQLYRVHEDALIDTYSIEDESLRGFLDKLNDLRFSVKRI